MIHELTELLRDYTEQFSSDPHQAARFYAQPAMVVMPDRPLVLETHADTEKLLGGWLQALRARDYARSDMHPDIAVQILNATTVLASVTFDRKRADGTVINQPRATYVMRQEGTGWQIATVIPTDSDRMAPVQPTG